MLAECKSPAIKLSHVDKQEYLYKSLFEICGDETLLFFVDKFWSFLRSQIIVQNFWALDQSQIPIAQKNKQKGNIF